MKQVEGRQVDYGWPVKLLGMERLSLSARTPAGEGRRTWGGDLSLRFEFSS